MWAWGSSFSITGRIMPLKTKHYLRHDSNIHGSKQNPLSALESFWKLQNFVHWYFVPVRNWDKGLWKRTIFHYKNTSYDFFSRKTWEKAKASEISCVCPEDSCSVRLTLWEFYCVTNEKEVSKKAAASRTVSGEVSKLTRRNMGAGRFDNKENYTEKKVETKEETERLKETLNRSRERRVWSLKEKVISIRCNKSLLREEKRKKRKSYQELDINRLTLRNCSGTGSLIYNCEWMDIFTGIGFRSDGLTADS